MNATPSPAAPAGPEFAEGIVGRVMASAIADNRSTAEIVCCLQTMAGGSNEQALALLNEAHAHMNKVLASAALDLRTQSHCLKG